MEWGVRVLAPQDLVRGYLVPDPDLGMAVAPSARYVDEFMAEGPYEVRTNAMGFRMDEQVSLSEDRLRIVVYGDSFTFGWGLNIEDTYFQALKAAAETADPRFQLLNAGVGGYGTGHVKILMTRHLRALKPAAVIYFFNSNDLTDNIATDIDFRVSELRYGDDGQTYLVDVPPFAAWKRFALNRTPYAWLNQHSHLFVLAKQQLKRLLRWKTGLVMPTVFDLPPRPPAGTPEAPTATTVTTATAPGPQSPDGAAANSEAFDHAVFVSELHVRRIAGLAAAATIPMLIAWVPSVQEMAPRPLPTEEMIFYGRGRAMLARLAAELPGLTFVDTVEGMPSDPAWKARQSSLRLSDGHFSAAGAAWYADRVKAPVLSFLAGVAARAAAAK